jgi:hypothetical protein
MTAKEKAVELIDFFTFNCKECDNAKISALIAVNQILESLVYKKLSDSPYTTLQARQFYIEVKQEIKTL